PNLLSAITPVGVPLVQYDLGDHYVGERTFVINHIAKYKNALKQLGFSENEIVLDSKIKVKIMKKEVSNCVYRWGYQHIDHFNPKNPNDGYINYAWEVIDKTFYNIEE
ncbi:MAG: hypothetical protein LBC08_03910, partial [Campylobacteraceae bacterium]|nr:hypothetical protein [Campylobacteraceae bacterium]